MKILFNSWKRWGLGYKFIINFVLAGLFLLTSFAIKNPAVPKAVAYNYLREAVKKSIYFKTWGWNTLEGEHFLIRYQDTDANVADLVLVTAEKYFEPVGAALEYVPQEKVPIIVYPDKASLNRSFGWDADESAMGVYWAGVIRILSPNDWVRDQGNMAQEFEEDGPVAHEYAHLVVDYLTGGNYPRWLTEGVAQFVEREVTGFEFPPTTVSGTHELYSFREMDATFDSLPNQALAYSQSLAAVELYVEQFSYASLQSLLLDLGRGKSLEAAFINVTGKSLEQFEMELQNWIVATQSLGAVS